MDEWEQVLLQTHQKSVKSLGQFLDDQFQGAEGLLEDLGRPLQALDPFLATEEFLKNRLRTLFQSPPASVGQRERPMARGGDLPDNVTFAVATTLPATSSAALFTSLRPSGNFWTASARTRAATARRPLHPRSRHSGYSFPRNFRSWILFFSWRIILAGVVVEGVKRGLERAARTRGSRFKSFVRFLLDVLLPTAYCGPALGAYMGVLRILAQPSLLVLHGFSSSEEGSTELSMTTETGADTGSSSESKREAGAKNTADGSGSGGGEGDGAARHAHHRHRGRHRPHLQLAIASLAPGAKRQGRELLKTWLAPAEPMTAAAWGSSVPQLASFRMAGPHGEQAKRVGLVGLLPPQCAVAAGEVVAGAAERGDAGAWHVPALSRAAATRLWELHLVRVFNARQHPTLCIEAVRGFANLETLHIERSTISDLPPVSGCALQVLSLAGCTVSELTPLSGCAQLRMLSLVGSSVSDLAQLQGGAIQLLSIAGCTHLLSLEGIQACGPLRVLEMICVPVHSLSSLSACLKLVRLDMSSCRNLTSLDPLAAGLKLEHLKMH
ncbi:hypothetical protein FOA52_009933 [Chlamydomonas sp. UWO 241]|nr:hypothetical protein FOA52_009933 [Chlamydomonas sp. UWO 241]